MSRIRSFKPRELIKKFEKAGYIIDRQKGSHVILYHPTQGKRLTIPLHGNTSFCDKTSRINPRRISQNEVKHFKNLTK